MDIIGPNTITPREKIIFIREHIREMESRIESLKESIDRYKAQVIALEKLPPDQELNVE